MEKSINEKNHKEVKPEVFPEMTAEEAKERTMEEIRRVVRILTARVETEMPAQGNFPYFFEIYYNPEYKLGCTEFMLIVSPNHPESDKEGTRRIVELRGYHLPHPYRATKVIASGTKDELMAALKEPDLPDELYAAARSLSKLFDSEVLSRG